MMHDLALQEFREVVMSPLPYHSTMVARRFLNINLITMMTMRKMMTGERSEDHSPLMSMWGKKDGRQRGWSDKAVPM